MSNLETLLCIECKVRYLPLFPKLKVLNCANNPITCPKLDVEDLYRMKNLLTSIPPLPNLIKLNCDNNRLTSLPYMPNLTTLNCRFN